MSLNQITQQIRKPFLNGRFESLKVDGTFGEETDLTLNLSGAITSMCDCKITKYGNLINVRLGTFIEQTTSEDYIYAINFPTEFIPSNITTICPLTVVNSSSNQSGAVDFNDIQPSPDSTGLRFQALSNDPSKFSYDSNNPGTLTAGIPGPTSFSYYLQ